VADELEEKAATGLSELEVRLRGRSCGGDGWRACGKAQTGQEGSDDLGVGDHGNHRRSPARPRGGEALATLEKLRERASRASSGELLRGQGEDGLTVRRGPGSARGAA
jgi:hypothetical protein